MKLYHGTISFSAEKIVNEGIDLNKGKPRVDFGRGFYMTPDKNFAISTARNKAEKTNLYLGEGYCYPAVLEYEYTLDDSLNILQFDEKDLSWAQFIINNRCGKDYIKHTNQNFHNLGKRFDIVIGEIADKKISDIARTLGKRNQLITHTELNSIQYRYKTEQYSFHTEKSVGCLEFLEYEIIK